MQFLASQANGVKSAKLPDALMNALKTLNGCIGNNKFLLGVSQVVNLLGDSPHLSKSSVRPLPVFGRRFLGNYKPLNKIYSSCVVQFMRQYMQREDFVLWFVVAYEKPSKNW